MNAIIETGDGWRLLKEGEILKGGDGFKHPDYPMWIDYSCRPDLFRGEANEFAHTWPWRRKAEKGPHTRRELRFDIRTMPLALTEHVYLTLERDGTSQDIAEMNWAGDEAEGQAARLVQGWNLLNRLDEMGVSAEDALEIVAFHQRVAKQP